MRALLAGVTLDDGPVTVTHARVLGGDPRREGSNRSIIELTERGWAVVKAVRAYKFLIMGDFLGQWDKAELEAFVPMIKRFGSWMDGIDPATEKYADEIDQLATGLGMDKSAKVA